MRALIRICLVALALTAGCGQKGPLVLPNAHAKTRVSVPAPATPPAATVPAAAPTTPASADALGGAAAVTPAAAATKPKDASEASAPPPRA